MVEQQRIEVAPGQRRDRQKSLGFFRQRRQHRFQVASEQAESIDARGADRPQFRRLPVRLGDFPGFALVEVLVGLVGEGHHQADRLAVFALLVQLGDLWRGLADFIDQGGVVELVGEHAGEILADEAGAAAGDVDELADEVGVHPLDEIFEVEVEIVNAGAEFRREVVAQVFGVQVVQIGAGVDEGAPGLRHLGAVDGDEAVDEDRVGRAVAGAGQHRRPEEGVEIDDVLADEVVELPVAAGPPPSVEVEALVMGAPAQVEEARHVTDGGVEPDVEILAGVAGNFEAEIGGVAADVPVLQAFAEPLLELVGHRPVDGAAVDPFAQHAAEGRHGEEEMLGFLLHRRCPREGGFRVDQLRRAVG